MDPLQRDKVCSLHDAVSHVRAGDAVHIMCGHTRWTAAANELVRQWWGREPGFTLVMLSLSSLGALFFRGGLVTKVVTGYSGDVFPNFTPNPVFADAYLAQTFDENGRSAGNVQAINEVGAKYQAHDK